MISSFTLENAIQADATDPLAEFRERFFLPTNDTGDALLYLCGNSLGLQPRAVPDLMAEELEDWARLGVTGHFDARRPWMPYHENLTANMAEIVGAQPDEVVVMNTLTVNLHLMMVSFYRPTGKRHKLLIEKPAFPSDRYAAESQVRYHRLDPADALLEIGPRDGEHTIRDEDLLQLIEREGESIALVMLPGVQYYSGQLFDIAAVSALATRTLAREEARSHGIFGAGRLAAEHLRAIAAVRQLTETRVWARDPGKAQAFAGRLAGETGLHVIACGPEKTAACDIVTTVTNAPEPILAGRWLQPGSHLNLVGAHRPDHCEADTDAVAGAAVFVDSRVAAMREAGDLLIPLGEGRFAESGIRGELGEVLAGSAGGRQDASERTVFKSLGHVAQDLYAAEAVYRRCNTAG